ncbi:3'-5' exonuclease [Mucilaginibacter agri]|uniref:3'-5' exonuclease n=1 Tax=Mucilaginibacter agri TaxID=2695265 RepID=A0A965ZLZ3_9SPHI|nr:3'-5' exonuclease [Mucilaginibacter agri]NCD72418.1 3'-5' exonuclease [Mucilaginibacter agri]
MSSIAQLANKYILFIDTEATGLPANWSAPVSNGTNWPSPVQVSWVVYDRYGNEIKKRNYYLNLQQVKIEESARAIHGITDDFLSNHGVPPAGVLHELSNDLKEFEPLMVGHFIRFDYYVLGAAFHRAGLPDPLGQIPVFCTMQATGQASMNRIGRQLHLSELYTFLFQNDLKDQHNALTDAEATAACFFELVNRGEIGSIEIERQNEEAANWRDPTSTRKGCLLPVVLFMLLFILVAYIAYL